MTGKHTPSRHHFSRRAMLAATTSALAMPFVMRLARAAIPLRMSTPGPADDWQSKGFVKFKEVLEQEAPGAFDVQIHYNGTLFAQGTEIEAMQRGNLELGVITPQDYAALIPEYSIFTTGYIYRDAAHLDAVFDGDIGTEYKARIAKDVGVQILRSQYFGARHVILRQAREVNTPADLAGLKLRMPAAESWLFLGNALGGNATPLAFEEIYLALQTGTIDGLENPLPDAMASKFYEVTQQVVLTSHLIASNFPTVAGKFWDGLSPELKTAVEKAEAAGKKLSDEGVAATEKDAKAFFESKGVRVTTPDVAAFRDQVQKKFVESDFAKAWPAGMLERINKAGA
jgi:tripartite ATP-independent transporter DctP family solute receptor